MEWDVCEVTNCKDVRVAKVEKQMQAGKHADRTFYDKEIPNCLFQIAFDIRLQTAQHGASKAQAGRQGMHASRTSAFG